MIVVGVGDGLAVGVRVTVIASPAVGEALAVGSALTDGVGVRVAVGEAKHRRQNGSPGMAPGPANSAGGGAAGVVVATGAEVGSLAGFGPAPSAGLGDADGASL